MADTADTLIAAAMALGYDGLSDRGLKECLLYAADTNGGGGGGSGSVEQGHGAPSGIPTDPLQPAIYTDLDTTFVYSWDVGSQAWVISSTSGGNAITQGHGAPVADPVDPTVPAVYVDLDSGTFYAWNVADQVWV
jgi:hypothetical protein